MDDAAVSKLARLLRADPRGPHQALEWERCRSEIGLELPADYRQFTDVFGCGSINDEFGVVSPFDYRLPGSHFKNFSKILTETFEGAGSAIAEMREAWPAYFPYPVFPEAGGLIAWGTNTNGDMCFWETASPDPEKWTVVVWLRGASPEQAWIRTGAGMVEFLIDIVSGRHPYSATLLVADNPVWLPNMAPPHRPPR